ncbi:MAG: TrmH family RNA methyltransferase [Treponema sp.]
MYEKELAVCGFEAVKALAAQHPEKIFRLFFTARRAPTFGKTCTYLAKQKRLYRLVSSDTELEKLCESVHHQGVVAMIQTPLLPPVTKETIERWSADGATVIVLDRVGNANNFGAIIRSAAFFGIENIVISAEEAQAGITPSAYRIAQGGMEFVSIYTTPSAQIFLKQCSGQFTRIGTDHRAYRNLSDIQRIIQPDEAVALVLGNEERGLSAEVKKLCDTLVKIRGTGAIESLNVAQAATLFFAELGALQVQRVASGEQA